MTSHADVTVIIPTVAEKSREDEIKRCIESVRNSSSSKINIITVVNGNRYDEAVCGWLKAQSDISVEFLEKGSAPNAVSYGRSLVDTPFFSTLDDDDEYLEGSTDAKLAVLEADSSADLVVTNGFLHLEGKDILFYSNMENVANEPLESLFVENWLNSGNALYRSDTVGVKFFKNYHPFGEWTWLAFQLLMAGKSLASVDFPTFRLYDTAESLSKTDAYNMAYFALFKRMLAANPPVLIKKVVGQKIGAAYHTEASRNLAAGKKFKAIKNHFSSLFYPGGFHYLLFGRKLLPGWPR